MQRARVRDWLVGAAGAVLVLAVGAVVAWWVLTSPPGVEEPGTESPPSAGAEGRRDPGPPPDLRGDQVWLADLALDAGTVVTAGSELRDVRAVGRDVVTGGDGLVAARVSVHATVPFPVVADELGERTEVRAAEGGQATVVRTVEALGRELRVVATGTVEVQGGRLLVEPRSIDIGGPELFADAIAAVVRRLVTIEHEVEGLPEGLALRDVAVRDDGFRVHLAGRDVRLVP